MPFEIVESWTGPVDFVLKIDGVAAVLSSDDVVTLILRGADRKVISTTGEVSILVPSEGKVRYVPSPYDFVASRGPYYARFQVVDVTSRKVFFPNGAADLITVYPA